MNLEQRIGLIQLIFNFLIVIQWKINRIQNQLNRVQIEFNKKMMKR